MGWLKALRNVSSLEERLTKVEDRLRQADLDWDNLYQMCRKLLGRTVKERASIEGAQKTEGAAPQLVRTDSPARGFLTDSQKQIQQNILRRRAGG